MKRKRDRIFFFIAALLSVASHVTLLYLIMSMPIGSDARAGTLFSSPIERFEIIPIDRSPDDLIVDPAAPTMPGDPASPAGATAPPNPEAMVGSTTRQMLGSIDPSALGGNNSALEKVPGFTASPTGEAAPTAPTVAHTPPAAAAPQPAPARVLDVTPRLIAGSSPSVTLPEFVSETDTVVAETPVMDRGTPAARIDVAQLHQLDQMLTPGGGATGIGAGTGVGAAAPGVPGGGIGGVPIVPRTPPTPPTVAAITPTPQAPRIPPKLPEPPPPVMKPAVTQTQPTIHLDEDFDYTLRTLPALPSDPGFFGLGGDRRSNEPGWFEVRMSPKRSIRRLKPLHKDVVYVLDTSESVSAAWIEQMKRGVIEALDSLNDGDRFNLVLFKENVSVMSPTGLMVATQVNKQAAQRFLTGAESSGWTDLNRALGRLIVRQTEPDRVYQIVLLSDGLPTRGEVDAREIINLITRENDGVAGIFAVAVGDRTNSTLLEFLTYRNKGFVLYPQGAGQAGTSIRELAARLRYPVVKDAVFTAVGVDTSMIYPRIPRDLYQGESVLLYGRYSPTTADRLSMRLAGTNGADHLDLTFTLDFRTAQPGDKALATAWAFWKLHHLYSEIIRTGETPAIKQQIDELRTRYKLKTAY